MNRTALAVAAFLFAPTAFAGSPYLPLDQGNRWEYRTVSGEHETMTVDGTETVFGTQTAVIRYSESTNNNGLENYWTTDIDGSAYLWGFYRPDPGEVLSRVYDPPIQMVAAPLELGHSWAQTVDVYSNPELELLYTVEFEFEVVAAGTIEVPHGSHYAYQVELRVPQPSPLGMSPLGIAIAERAGEVLQQDWWSPGVGVIQHGTFHIYQLVSFGGPTPTLETSWGGIKTQFRTDEQEAANFGPQPSSPALMPLVPGGAPTLSGRDGR